MRIVIDLQGAQTESRFRGIGRYTLSLTEALVRNAGQHEVIVLINECFEVSLSDLRQRLQNIIPPQNILSWKAPGPIKAVEPENRWRRETSEILRESFIDGLHPDVVLITSLFEGFVDDAVTSIGTFAPKVPTAVVLYDLIPYIQADLYLRPNPTYASFYREKIAHLKRANLWLGISQSACDEAASLLDPPEGHVACISTACDAVFRPQRSSAKAKHQILSQLALEEEFILYVGGSDPRKNLARLVEAYAALPEDLRNRHALVMAGRMPSQDVLALRRIASSRGLKDKQIHFIGYIDDPTLARLYSLCRVFVFPSLHEGFGLPVLEAISCGAVTIASNNSSIPEILGKGPALFDPLDLSSIRETLRRALTDEGYRQQLKNSGRKRQALFSWDLTARRALKAMESLVSSLPPSYSQRPWPERKARLESLHREVVYSIGTHRDESSPTLKDFELTSESLAFNEQALEAYVLREELPSKISWQIEGPFDSSYSLALVNREIARSLRALGHHVSLFSMEGGGPFPASKEFLKANPEIAEMHRESQHIAGHPVDVCSRDLYPPTVTDMPGRLHFLHSYAWEESGFPDAWVQSFNQELDGIMVISEHVKKIMIDHGVTVPIATTGCGVDHFERVDHDPDFRVEAKAFRFLHVSSCFPRKGADVLLRAYGRAFSQKDSVTLIIKTFPNPHNEIHRWLKEAQAETPDFPDVLIIEKDLTEAELKSLYMNCQALIAPSRAEGYGLPLAEAMLTGIPVITTAWGGQLDFCHEENAWLVDYSFARSASHLGVFDSVWAEPDLGHLSEVLRDVYTAKDSTRKAKEAKAKGLLKAEHSWRSVGERMVATARLWGESPVALNTPRIGWISTWNTRCGIATTSEHLVKEMKAKISILAPQANGLGNSDGPGVCRCWNLGEEDTLESLANQIEAQSLDTLVIQFNYGFFQLETLNSFLIQQAEAGRTILIVLHSTTDPIHVPHKRLSVLKAGLSMCDRILVHSIADLNRLKTLDLVDNVALFPLGILEVAEAAPTSGLSGELVVSSYGFFLPHKGLLELIESIDILRRRGIPARLHMVNSEYPAPESKHIIQQAMALISDRDLEPFVQLTTDFLSDDQSLAHLKASDLIVFPYQATGESASGAVRYGIASGRAVAVTPLPIFDDVEQAVWKLPGTAAAEIAEGIARYWQKKAENAPEVIEREIRTKLWRDAHGYSKLARRLLNLATTLRNQKRFIADGALKRP